MTGETSRYIKKTKEIRKGVSSPTKNTFIAPDLNGKPKGKRT